MCGFSILCGIHSADETQPGPTRSKQQSIVCIFWFQCGPYPIVVTLRFSFLPGGFSLAAIVFLLCLNEKRKNWRLFLQWVQSLARQKGGQSSLTDPWCDIRYQTFCSFEENSLWLTLAQFFFNR